MPKRIPQDWETLEGTCTQPASPLQRSRLARGYCSPRAAGTNSPRPASNSGSPRKTSRQPWA